MISAKSDLPTFFPNAQSPTINGGVIAAVQGNAYFGSPTSSIAERRGMKLLLENIASGAFHDAAERGDPPKCHKDTRKSIIAQITDWIDKTEMWYYSFLWLNGPAGAGKSALLQTIAELCALREILVGSFFFARTAPERNNPSRFIATLAYQLALAIPEVQERVIDAVEADPTIFTRKLATQAEVLIVQPMKAMMEASGSWTGPEGGFKPMKPNRKVFIVDALDECVSAAAQREVLDSVAKIVESFGWNFNNPAANDDMPTLLFVLSSRPEYEFRQAFSSKNYSSFSLSCATNVVLQPDYDADLDIEVFLQATFQKIKDTHPVRAHLPQEWPTAQQMRYLVETSSSQFIYAAIAAKYIDSPRHNPATRLNVVLAPGNLKGKNTPFSQLDALYRLVLGAVSDLSMVLEILTFLILRTSKTTLPNIWFVSALFGFDQVDVRLALTDMYALMNVPANDDDKGDLLRLHHASMIDFLTDASRAGEFYIDSKEGHTHLAALFVRYLTRLQEEASPLIDVMITGFFTHFPHSSLTDELQWALDNFSLGKWLQKVTMAQFYNTNWSDLFMALKDKEFSQATVYPQGLVAFDNWVLNRLDQYPQVLLACIPAAYSIFPQHFLNSTAPIFSIVMARQSDIEDAKQLDETLFNFQDQDQDIFEPLFAFFNDPTRSGKYFPSEASFKALAQEIVENIFPKEQDTTKTLRIHVWTKGWSPPYNRPYEGDEDGVISVHHRFSDFHFFQQILARCPNDNELAIFLRGRVLQLPKRQKDRPRDRARIGRINLGKAGLQYVKECAIPYLDHVHIPNLSVCFICDDLEANSSETSEKRSSS